MIAAGIGTILPGARDTGDRLCYRDGNPLEARSARMTSPIEDSG
jgi:hypothetical protein